MLTNYDIHIQVDSVQAISSNGTRLQPIEKSVDIDGNPITAFYVVSDFRYNVYVTYNKITLEIRALQAAWTQKNRNSFTHVQITGNSDVNFISFAGTTYSKDQHELLMDAIGEFLHEMFNAYFDL